MCCWNSGFYSTRGLFLDFLFIELHYVYSCVTCTRCFLLFLDNIFLFYYFFSIFKKINKIYNKISLNSVIVRFGLETPYWPLQDFNMYMRLHVTVFIISADSKNFKIILYEQYLYIYINIDLKNISTRKEFFLPSFSNLTTKSSFLYKSCGNFLFKVCLVFIFMHFYETKFI